MTDSTYTDEFTEIMREAEVELDRERQVCQVYNDRIFQAITSQIGAGFLNDLKQLFKNCEGLEAAKHRLVRHPTGKFQQEHEYGCIVGVWIKQYQSGEDSFYGTIGVKLKDGLWFEFDFAC